MSAVLVPLAQARVQGPSIDWAGLSPLLALLGGATFVLLLGLVRARAAREVLVPLVALILAFALYPQIALHKGEPAVVRSIAAARQAETQPTTAQAEVTP